MEKVGSFFVLLPYLLLNSFLLATLLNDFQEIKEVIVFKPNIKINNIAILLKF